MFQEKKEFEEKYQKYREKPESRQKLEKWYRSQIIAPRRIILLCLAFLLLSSFGQLAILGFSLEKRFDLVNSDKILGIQIKVLLGFLVAAALPITTVLDESGLFGEKIKISLLSFWKFSPIMWIVLPGDMLLTFQAILVMSNERIESDLFIPVTAFIVSAIFSISALYLSKGIVASFKKLRHITKNLQIITIYGINPIPLYKDAEQIRLTEEKEAAIIEAEETKKTLEEEMVRFQEDLESQRTNYEEQLKSQELEHSQKEQELVRNLDDYKDYFHSYNQLQKKFNQVRKPIVDFLSQGQGVFERFSTLGESVKEFNFPKLDIRSTTNGKVVEVSKYHFMLQDSNYSWQDLQLPSELSPVGRSLLEAMKHQHELPIPKIRNYAPREGLSKCLVLEFDHYVIVYCRDEEYWKDGEKWNIQDILDFQDKLIEQQSLNGLCTLEFTAQQIMSDQLGVLERIKEAFNSKIENEYN